MALFQVRSRFASVLRHHYRSSSSSRLFSLTTPELRIPTSLATSVLSHHYRSSSSGNHFSTMMKTPTIKDASNHLNRTVEERNEKHSKVQQLAKDDKLRILSCESTADGGVCDVYVVGVNNFYSYSPEAAQAIMSYLKPQVLYLPFGYKTMPSKLRSWPTVEHVAYQEATKYGCNVVLEDRPEEIAEEWWEMMPADIQLDDIYIFHTILPIEQEKLARLMAHRLLEVARKNSSVVAIVPCPRDASRSFDYLGRINEYWKQLIETSTRVAEVMRFQAKKMWRLVGLVSSVVGLLCFALSDHFKRLIRGWNPFKFFCYLGLSLVICAFVLYAKRSSFSSQRKRYIICYVVFLIISVYSFFYDKAVDGKPGILSLVSNVAFALVSLSLSKLVDVGFDTGTFCYFLGCFTIQLLTINWKLILVATIIDCPLFLLHFSSDF